MAFNTLGLGDELLGGGEISGLRQQKLRRWGSLQLELAPWINRYREVSNNILPFNGRFFTTDRNRGDKNFNNILDETATFASRITVAGLMSGVSSPTRPWIRLATPDPDLNDRHNVKVWLTEVRDMILRIFNRNNTYRMLPMIYEELLAFATAANYTMPDFDFLNWHKPLTAGEYAISTDGRGRVNTLYREFEMKVSQIYTEFVLQPDGTEDWSVVSASIKNRWNSHAGRDQWWPLLHVVEPRSFQDRTSGSALSGDKPWRSLFIEMGRDNGDQMLRDSGFDDFRILAPRWATRGGDEYGYGPGFEAMGSIKQLQQEQLRKGQAIDFQTYPPVMVPGDLKGQELDNLPGGVNYYTSINNQKIQSLYDAPLSLTDLKEDILDVRARINRAFYTDLFLAVIGDTRTQPRAAREIVEVHEEKLLQLGPVLERLHDELLTPLVDLTFTDLVTTGSLPLPPPELEGQQLSVEFISILAQAQRAVGLGSMDRLIATVGAIGSQSGDTKAWDKLDQDEIVNQYADRLAVDPEIIVSNKDVAIIRQERVRLQQMQQAAALAPALKDGAQAAEAFSKIPADSPVAAGAAEGLRSFIQQRQ